MFQTKYNYFIECSKIYQRKDNVTLEQMIDFVCNLKKECSPEEFIKKFEKNKYFVTINSKVLYGEEPNELKYYIKLN